MKTLLVALAILALPLTAQAQTGKVSRPAIDLPQASAGQQESSQAIVAKVEDWLRNLRTGQARFTQKGFDGAVTTGTFYIWRPGRLRFEYDPPVKDFIVADGVLLHYYDAQQRQTSTAPVGTTLADFLLRKNPRLNGDVTVQNVRERDGMYSLTVAQTADPSAGQVTMNFTKEPFALRSWTVLDAQGLTTDVTLEGLQTGQPLPPALFNYKDPTGRTRLND